MSDVPTLPDPPAEEPPTPTPGPEPYPVEDPPTPTPGPDYDPDLRPEEMPRMVKA